MSSTPSTFGPFTAVQSQSVTPSKSDNVDSDDNAFHFTQLPGELREAIYLFAFQPIIPLNTASIAGTPDWVRIPHVAQVSKQLREEALHVLFKHTPVEISLHCIENLRRARSWTKKCTGGSSSFGVVIFSGCLTHVEHQFYYIKVQCGDDAPYFSIEARPGASSKADQLIARIEDRLVHFLKQEVKKTKQGQERRFSGQLIADMLELVFDAASSFRPISN